MEKIKQYMPGILASAVLAVCANFLSGLIPYGLISGSVFALLLGMLINRVLVKYALFSKGVQFTSHMLLRVAVILMGASLSFAQVLQVGKFSLFVMCFTLLFAFGGGHLLGKLFGMNWEMSSLISAGTGICGGSAVAAIAPVIHAKDRDIAYAISATFLFDIVMVILFPLAGRYFGMSDLGYGLWAGTAVNDTSSVIAAGYAFSDAAGAYSVIVKLTRTLSIVPTVLVFSLIYRKIQRKEQGGVAVQQKVQLGSIIPYFILGFLAVVALKSVGAIPDNLSQQMTTLSKFLMVMALGAIGLKTNFSELARSGFKPMLHGFLVSALVVVVSFLVQMLLGQI